MILLYFIVWYGDVVRMDEWTADKSLEGGLNDNC